MSATRTCEMEVEVDGESRRKGSEMQMDAGEEMDLEEAVEATVRKRFRGFENLPIRAEEKRRETDPRREVEEAAQGMADSKAPKTKRRKDMVEAYWAALAKEPVPEDSCSDPYAYTARLYRDSWIQLYGGHYGTFEDTTSIPPMRFTDHTCDSAGLQSTMEIFSIKIAEITGGLAWPLDVYGMVAARDVVDHNRNILFNRQRDNCQTITKEDPYLVLTGPTRAVVLSVDPSHLEVVLKVKGNTESEDKDLSFLAVQFRLGTVFSRDISSRLSTLEFMVGHIAFAVEATISVEVIRGEWPCGFRGVFTASTASIADMEVVLLAFGDDKLPVEDNGKIKLSRQVVCVELLEPKGTLKVSAQALRDSEEKDMLRDDQVFTPEKAGRSRKILKVGSCEMEVTVAWSLLTSWSPSRL